MLACDAAAAAAAESKGERERRVVRGWIMVAGWIVLVYCGLIVREEGRMEKGEGRCAF